MPITATAPANADSVHPTLPLLMKPFLSPGSSIWVWSINPASVVVPIVSSEYTMVNARIDAVALLASNPEIPTAKRYYSQVSILNAEALGKNSFPYVEEGNEFYAVYKDGNGAIIRSQHWMYQGEHPNYAWKKLTDTEAVDNTEVNNKITVLETNVSELQVSVLNTASNVIVKLETLIQAPSEFVMPASILALDPSAFDPDEVIQVMFKDAVGYYTSNGTVFAREDIRYYGGSGDMPPDWPNAAARVQAFPVPGDENVVFFGFLKTGGDRNVSMLDQSTVNGGKDHWIWAGQPWGEFHHPAIMHMAIVGSQWHVHEYTGHDIGDGVIGGVFTFVNAAATLTQRRASPIGNDAFTERKV